jgi:hypothetical protein
MPAPYNGDPTKFPEAVTLYDDSLAPTAANINKAPQGLLDRTAWLRARLGVAAIGNWGDSTTLAQFQTLFSLSTPVGFGGVAYDPRFARWLVAIEDLSGPTTYLVATYDSGASWALIGSQTGNPVALGSTALAATLGGTASAYSIVQMASGEIYSVASGTFTLATGTYSGAAAASAIWYNGSHFGAYYVDILSGTYVGHLAYSSNSTGTLFGDQSGFLTGAFAGGTDNIDSVISTQVAGGDILVAICGETPGTDNSYLGLFINTTFTALTPSFLTVQQKITGLTYDFDAGIAGVAIVTGDGQSEIWTSADFTTWTQVYDSATGAIQELAVLKGVWVITDSVAGPANQTFYSVDVPSAGPVSHWYTAPGNMTPFLGHFVSNGAQLGEADATSVRFSNFLGPVLP